MKTKGISAIIWYVVAIAAIGFLAQGKFQGGQLFATYGLEEAVFCNVYEFQSCGLQKQGSIQAELTQYLFQSPKTLTCGYDKCIITNIISKDPSYADVKFNGGNAFSLSVPYTLNFGDNLALGSGVSMILNYDYYNRRLAWCGGSACDAAVTGITVIGSDKCTFTTDKSIYDKYGLVTRQPGVSSQSYTVPVGESIQIFNGQQFICGTKFNQCASDADCTAGHTYLYNGLGAEASAGTLQVYGCVSGGTAPTQEQKDVLAAEKSGVTSTSFNYGNRCQVKNTVSVQCIPGTASCGANAVCDISTFTCKAAGEVKCNQDRDCGAGEVYDQATKSYYGFACRNPGSLASYCDRNLLRKVDCKYNTECPASFYCDVGGICKQSVNPPQACPNACCEGDVRYFDKPAPPGQVCCPGGQSFASTLQACTASPPPPPGALGIFEMIVIVLLLLGGILIVPKLIPQR